MYFAKGCVHGGDSGTWSEYLGHPLLPLQGRHLIEGFDDVQRDILVHAQLQNLGFNMKKSEGNFDIIAELLAKTIMTTVEPTMKTRSFLSFQMPYTCTTFGCLSFMRITASFNNASNEFLASFSATGITPYLPLNTLAMPPRPSGGPFWMVSVSKSCSGNCSNLMSTFDEAAADRAAASCPGFFFKSAWDRVR